MYCIAVCFSVKDSPEASGEKPVKEEALFIKLGRK